MVLGLKDFQHALPSTTENQHCPQVLQQAKMPPPISKWLLVESHGFRCCLATQHSKITHFLPEWDCLCVCQQTVSFLKAHHTFKLFFLLEGLFLLWNESYIILFCFVLLIIMGIVKHTQIEQQNEPPRTYHLVSTIISSQTMLFFSIPLPTTLHPLPVPLDNFEANYRHHSLYAAFR